MSKMGRPTLRTPEVVATILEGLSNGQTLVSLCSCEGMPSPSTFRSWAREDAQLSADFARARDDGFDAIADSILEIVDDGRNDFMEGQDGQPAYNAEHVQRSKLRAETRLKLLAKWDPRRYGERVAVDHGVQDNLAQRLREARERAKGD